MDNSEVLLKKVIEKCVFTTKRQQKIISPKGDEQSWLMDFRSVLLEPEVLNLVADIFIKKTADCRPFQVAGLESASIPFVTAIVLKTHQQGRAVNGFYIRKSRKREGLMKIIEGNVTDDKVILVDDLINSGKSFTKQVEVVESAGKKVEAIFALVRLGNMDRYEYFHKKGIKIISLFSLADFQGSLNALRGASLAPRLPFVPFREEWNFKSPNPSYHWVVPKSAPVLDEKKLYFGSDSSNFWALFQEDGTVAWSFKAGKPVAGKSIFSSPAIYNNAVYFGSYDGNVYALDAETGKQKWVFMEADWIGSSPAIAPELGLLFVGTEYSLHTKRGGIVALDLETGEKKWEYIMPEYTHCSPTFIKSANKVVIGSNDFVVYMFEAQTGKLAWSYKVGAEVKGGFVADEKRKIVAFGSFDCFCYVLDVASGRLVYKIPTEAGIYSIPIIYKNSLIFASLDKRLYSLNLDSGLLDWSFKTNGRIFASPLVLNDRVLIGSNDGRLYEIDAETGKEIGFHQFVERITNKIGVNEKTGKFFVPTFANEIFCLSKVPPQG